MPRDASDTKDRLLSEAERLFATRGIYQATTRDITAAAGQKNTSALTYHFGSREGVLREILRLHGDPLDAERGRLIREPLADQPTRELLAALLVPYANCLRTERGRNYLRIVAQLTESFAVWRIEDELSPPNLRRVLSTLEARVDAPVAVARERVVAIIMLMTTAFADRARRRQDGGRAELGEARFVANLADMMVACLEAPVGKPFGE